MPLPSYLPVANPTASVWQTSHKTSVACLNSTLGLPARATAVIVGSGITAAFATRQLLSTNPQIDVLVLEARGTCSGATGRNGGHLQPFLHAEERQISHFELRNFDHVADMIERKGIPCDFRRLKGVLGFWNVTYFKEVVVQLSKLRNTWPELDRYVSVVEDPQQLRDLQLKNAVGAIINQMAASLSPYKLVTWMWEDMLKQHPNLNLQTNTAVTEIRSRQDPAHGGKDWIISTARGCVSAEYLMLTTNAYTAHLLPQFKDLITPVQIAMAAFKPPSSSHLAKSLVPHSYAMFGVGQMDRVQGDHLVQRPTECGGHFMFGGARVVAKVNGVGICDDSYIDETARLYLRKQLGLLLNFEMLGDEDCAPKADFACDGEWTGICGYSHDGRPWVGGVPGMAGVFLCAGYTGHGMPNAALCGEHVASLISSAIHGCRRQESQQQSLQRQAIPASYAISQERIDGAMSLPMFPVANQLVPC